MAIRISAIEDRADYLALFPGGRLSMLFSYRGAEVNGLYMMLQKAPLNWPSVLLPHRPVLEPDR
jgi:hypothetical protein